MRPAIMALIAVVGLVTVSKSAAAVTFAPEGRAQISFKTPCRLPRVQMGGIGFALATHLMANGVRVVAPDIEPEDRRIGGELMIGQARILHQQSAHGPSPPVVVEPRHLPLAK